MSKKRVQKFTPQTRCEKVPVELCGPAGCGVKPGPEECQVPAENKTRPRLPLLIMIKPLLTKRFGQGDLIWAFFMEECVINIVY